MSRPWMPLYVADYLADTGHLSMEEHGAYLLLIMHYWQRGSLPNDDRKLASIARAMPQQWVSIRDTIAGLFGENWTHARIDRELEKAREKYEKRANAGRAGGKAKAAASSNATAMPHQTDGNALPTTTTTTEEDVGANAPTSPEPDKSAPVAFELPCVSGKTFPIYATDIDEWASAFPAVDIRQQLGAARSWLIANPTRAKTERGMRKFIVSWLDRRQNAGGQAPIPRATAPPATRSMNDVLNELQGKSNNVSYPGSTVDGSLNRADSGGSANLVQFDAVAARFRS